MTQPEYDHYITDFDLEQPHILKWKLQLLGLMALAERDRIKEESDER